MANYFANVETTETFYNWLTKTNDLLDSLSTEIITANTTFGQTGIGDGAGGAVTEYRNSLLYGKFTANTLVAYDNIRGGNNTHSGLLTVSSNVVHIGSWANTYANVHVDNSTANVVVSDNFRVIGNTNIQYVDQTDAIIVAKNGAVSNIHMTANEMFANSDNTFIVANTTVTGNTFVKANSSIFNINVHTNGTVSNVNVFADSITIFDGNVHITGTISHTVAGNVAFDGTTLFVDSINNRVGVGTSTPDANLQVLGTANISSNTWIGGNTYINNTAIIAGNTTINDPSFFRVHDASGYRLQVDTGGNTGIGIVEPTANAKLEVLGTANVSSDVVIGGTLIVDFATRLNNILDVYNNIHLANADSTVIVDGATAGTNKLTIEAAGNVGVGTSTPDAKLQVLGTANVSSSVHLGDTLDVTSDATFGTTIALQDNSLWDMQETTIGTSYATVYTFNGGTYRGGKFVATAGVNGSTQTSEFVVAANSTNGSALTVYGTVTIPGPGDIVDFEITNNGSGTINVRAKSTDASTNVKILANLIK